MNSELIPPVLGVANNATFFKQPGGTAPPGTMLNVRAFTVHKDRPQVGQRPGIVKAFATQMGGGAGVQAMGVVSRSRAISGYRVGDSTTIDGTGRSILDGALLGQVWQLERNFSMLLRRYENVSASGEFSDTGPTDQSVNAIAYSDGNVTMGLVRRQVLVYASNYQDGSGFLVARVTCLDAKTGTVLWSHKIERTGETAFVNALVCSDRHCFVCTNQYVRVLKLADGTQFGTEFACNGWSQEVVGCALIDDNASLLIAFRGSSAIVTLHSGVVVNAPTKASFWRSGVMKATIQPSGSAAPLVQETFGPQLPITDRYYEGGYPTYSPHNYLRLSEVLPGCGPDTALSLRQPRGVWPTGICALPDGGFAVSHTNTGWGPNSNNLHNVPNGWPANDYCPPGPPYRTLSIFDSGGSLVTTVDTFSIVELKGDGFYSDIPQDSTQDPSVLAIAADAAGTIYVGGRRNASVPANAFAFTRFGLPVWAVDLGQTIRENGVTVAKDDGNPLFGGDRSSTWPDSGAANAHLWKLVKDTGAVLAHKDLGSAVSCLGVDTNTHGDIAYCTDKVP